MELVYLWVEEYKNIHRQGFNFSPRFNCHYDEGSNELTIDENDGYIENFFNDNINVTAIVGKNGSGKSSLLEIIKILGIDNYTTRLPATLFVKDKDKYYYLSSHDNDYSIVKGEETLNLEKYSSQINTITHSSDMLNWFLSFNQDNNVYDLGGSMESSSFQVSVPTDDIYWDTFKLDIMKYRTKSQSLMLKYFFTNKDIDFFKPDKYALHCKNTYLVRKIVKIVSYFSADNMKSIKRNVEDFISSFSDCEKMIKIYLFLAQLPADNGSEAQHIYNAYENKKLLNNKEINTLLKNKDDILSINKYIIENIKYDKAYSLRGKKEILLKILENKYSKDIFSDLLQIHLFEEKTHRAYKDLSSGEKDFIFLLSFLDFYLNSDQNNLILLDEVEAFAHPKWSKNTIKEIYHLLGNKHCHFVFTTHSPFLLSDIPKQNIIFLDVDENKNCKVLTHDEVFSKKQTFGQNIHTLLSDSFFMDEGGLMGEFAKRKINKIIEYLRDDSENKNSIADMPKYDNWLYDKENLKKIIDAIGEPFLRHKILELYYDKFTDDATEAERKKELLKQKERIERELSRYD